MDGPASNNGESSSPSEGGGGGEASASGSAEERWTCEACGCNTNLESDRSCTICGTSRSDGACWMLAFVPSLSFLVCILDHSQ